MRIDCMALRRWTTKSTRATTASRIVIVSPSWKTPTGSCRRSRRRWSPRCHDRRDAAADDLPGDDGQDAELGRRQAEPDQGLLVGDPLEARERVDAAQVEADGLVEKTRPPETRLPATPATITSRPAAGSASAREDRVAGLADQLALLARGSIVTMVWRRVEISVAATPGSRLERASVPTPASGPSRTPRLRPMPWPLARASSRRRGVGASVFSAIAGPYVDTAPPVAAWKTNR
jgi:hypothetical protein